MAKVPVVARKPPGEGDLVRDGSVTRTIKRFIAQQFIPAGSWRVMVEGVDDAVEIIYRPKEGIDWVRVG